MRAEWDAERAATEAHIRQLETHVSEQDRRVQEMSEQSALVAREQARSRARGNPSGGAPPASVPPPRDLFSASAGPPVRNTTPGSVHNAPGYVLASAPLVTPVSAGMFTDGPIIPPQHQAPLIPLPAPVGPSRPLPSLPQATYVEGAALDPRGQVYNAVYNAGQTGTEWGKERVAQAESEYYAVGPFDIFATDKEDKLKIPIDPFKGNHKDNPRKLISFLRQIEEGAYGAHWGYVRKGRELRLRLADDAADQVTNLNHVEGHDYNVLVTALYNAYIPHVIQAKAQYELSNLKQGDHTPQEQGRKVRDLCLVAYPPHVAGNTDQYRRHESLTHFLRSIPPGNIRSYVSYDHQAHYTTGSRQQHRVC